MSSRRRWARALRKIERDLAADPGLDALFQSFACWAGGLDLSWVEKTRRRRRAFRRGQRSGGALAGPDRDWCDDRWKDL
jgi:hypothetical protein